VCCHVLQSVAIRVSICHLGLCDARQCVALLHWRRWAGKRVHKSGLLVVILGVGFCCVDDDKMHYPCGVGMGWLRLVGSLKLQVSFAKETYKRDDILQKRPIILRSLLIVAIP